MNTIEITSNLPSFLQPYTSNIIDYFNMNHTNDLQDNDMIRFDIARYIMDDLIYQEIYKSLVITTDESKYRQPPKKKRTYKSKCQVQNTEDNTMN